MILVYIREAIANTHTLKLINAKYKPRMKPHNDSVIASHKKYFIAVVLTLAFHITPIINPHIETDNDSNANHCAGNSLTIVFNSVGCAYVIKSPDITRLTNSHF
jgi:hypothetical protein